jgi:hypothetical protein
MANHPLDAMPSTAYSPERRSAAAQASPYGGMGGIFLLWLAFGALMLFWPDTLMSLWDRFLDWTLILQVVVGVLLLPWVVATWVWQSDWSTLTRALVIGFLVIGTMISFAPASGVEGGGLRVGG